MNIVRHLMIRGSSIAAALLVGASVAQATLVTDPNDPRDWLGATVGTFAQLFFGADNATTRQQVIDSQLLDDGLFDFSGATGAPMIAGGGGTGFSLDSTGTGSFDYGLGGDPVTAGSFIDNLWVQTSGAVGVNIWDLGAPATKAAVFNTIDHGPLPGEAIESTVYLSNDMISWTLAVTERVWLEGWEPILGIKWDGFVYAVGTGTSSTFRYASIIWGGPGALQADGDNEINGIMGLDVDFNPVIPIPLPGALPLLATAVAALGIAGMRRRRA